MIRPEELDEKLLQCTRCGTCLKDCPIYAETADEAFAPRAKVQLTKALVRGRLTPTPHLGELAQMCLLCRACLNACPNQVDGPEYSLHLRDTVVRACGQSAARRAIFRGVLPRPGLLKAAGRAARVAQRLGLDRAKPVRAALRALPGVPDDLPDYAPALTKVPLSDLLKRRGRKSAGQGPRQGPRVAYFYGCVHNLAFPETGLATVEVLERNGCQVVVPEQGCCGVPAWANGDTDAARRMAADNLRSFASHDFDYIITDCASCGSTLKDYGKLLGTAEAETFAAKVVDIHKFLVSQGFTAKLGELGAAVAASASASATATVTYHDPCHLVRWQGVSAEPRAVLKAIPGLTLKEMKEADRCCGAAGSFAITHRELSQKIGARKAANIVASGAEMVATGCPSCRIQIAYELKRAGHPMRVAHPIELLAEAYRKADNADAATERTERAERTGTE